MDADRVEGMQRAVEAAIGSESKQLITQLLGQIDSLNGAEKLLLYLKLPTGPPPVDPLKQPVNPLGSRSEIQQTVMWIQTHLEVDPEISLPKQDVYEEYIEYCSSTKMKPLSTADFGKVMKQVYPCVKPRRLGTRGNSRYCYAGMRKRVKLEVPQLPDLREKPKTIEIPSAQNDVLVAASHVVREWAEKRLGLKFGNLCTLAQHLIDKNLVDRSSTAAHVISNTSSDTESFESTSIKSLDYGNKVQQRGVIKQLKRKIQGQPQSSGKVSSTKKLKLREDTPEDDKSASDANREPGNPYLKPDVPLKMEVEQAIPDYSFQPSHLAVRKQEYPGNTAESSVNVPPTPLNTFNSSFPTTEYSQNVAVNLSQSSIPKSRFSPQLSMGGIKPSPLSVRQLIYNDPYKFDHNHFSESKPMNLRFNNVTGCSETLRSPNTINNNVPINLSNNSDCENSLKCLKSPVVYGKEFESPTSQCETNSLNLSVHRRDVWFPQEMPNATPSIKLPLPGKKMFLETYNANQMVSANLLSGNQNAKSAPYSPAAIDRGQYLPKKMRATESFGGKLASSKLNEAVSVDLQQNEPEKYNKLATEVFKQSSTQNLQNNVPNSSSDIQFNVNSDIKREPDVKIETAEFANPINPVSSGSLIGHMQELQNIQKCSIYKKGQRIYKGNNKRVIKAKSPDSTSSFSKNDISLQSVPVRAVTRGRPRKKSLTKAKYTRRQPRVKVNDVNVCGDIKHHKRSSDSISSLTESINIKSGIICAENHSEIMNRERVSSICNMDKHALDDYLNEGNSQEHEEELLKYFQQDPDNLPTDNIDKDNLLDNAVESDTKTDTAGSYIANNEPNNEVVLNSSTITSVPNTNLDINEDHSQGNTEKISQLREILKKNLKHNVTSTSMDNSKNQTGFNTNSNPCGYNLSAENSESAFTTIARRKPDNEQENLDFQDNLTISNQNVIAKKPSNGASSEQLSPTQENKSLKRRVSFENQTSSSNENPGHDNNKGQNSVPQSPTSRVQHFNFMPISPGRLSPTLNKNSPIVTPYKSATSPAKISSTTSTSPVSLSSSASPFVSPRNTPVPRARNICNDKPSKNKKLPRLGIPNNLHLGEKILTQKDTHGNGSFIIPNEHSTIPRSPGYATKMRTFPMSAPPSPNILTSKYKPCFTPQPQTSSAHILSNNNHDNHFMPCFANREPSTVNMETFHNDSQPHSADPLSHEISQFFTDTDLPPDDPINNLRSQSVPLHQNSFVMENRSFYFNNTQCDSNMSSAILTPCNSVPPTPVPNEFCDFDSLNDTCESISKVGLNTENLDKIYNVLNSEAQETLMKRDDILLNTVESNTSFSRNMSSILTGLDIGSMMSQNGNHPPKMTFNNQMHQNYSGQSHEAVKRSNSLDMNENDVSVDNRFYLSRSVPSTPLPGSKIGLPNFDLSKANPNQSYGDDFSTASQQQRCGKNLLSKSVPSTPLLTDERNVFSYSNRDFLINGNSVDQSIATVFADKKIPNENQLDQSFLNDGGALMEDKNVLGVLTSSPLPETIDINNDLTSFNDDCIDMAVENDILDIIL